MVQIYTEIEIPSPPLRVKGIFTDSDNIPQWHKGMIILLRNPEKPVVEEGGGLEINIDGMVIKCDVIQNTPNVFSWSGSFYGLIVGRHIFQFLESEMNPGGTRLVQTEDISGPLQFLFEPWWPEWLGGIERVATNKFNELNGHLKERAERS